MLEKLNVLLLTRGNPSNYAITIASLLPVRDNVCLWILASDFQWHPVLQHFADYRVIRVPSWEKCGRNWFNLRCEAYNKVINQITSGMVFLTDDDFYYYGDWEKFILEEPPVFADWKPNYPWYYPWEYEWWFKDEVDMWLFYGLKLTVQQFHTLVQAINEGLKKGYVLAEDIYATLHISREYGKLRRSSYLKALMVGGYDSHEVEANVTVEILYRREVLGESREDEG